jgi:hypothetical protein
MMMRAGNRVILSALIIPVNIKYERKFIEVGNYLGGSD